MTEISLNMTSMALNMNGFVHKLIDFVLDITKKKLLNMTGFVLNMTVIILV